ncbi:MAG: carboxypeptidase regulatory-like domain-containing protein [Anaerolineales bacterium]|nr:carboxypeptidase regulatory-like domain-containing protein [Anaerolineales bacterium]
MKRILFIKWPTLIVVLLLLAGLSSGMAYADVTGKNFVGTMFSSNNGNAEVVLPCPYTFPFSAADTGAALILQDSASETTVFASAITPTATIDLVMNGPAAVAAGETFSVEVVAQNVPDPGLYGVQFEINFIPALITLNNPQPNPDLSFVVRNEVDNTLGKLRLVASRQGNVPGLTGDVTLLTFDATAGNIPCLPTLTFANVKIGDSQAQPFNVIPHNYTISIGLTPTPTPITPTPETPTATPETPTVTPETPTATPETPTVTPETPTATPETPTATPETPTATPETPTATPETPTATPETPTATPETPTATPETPTATPETPTATPETPTPTPETPTPTPTTATVSGQVILSGQANSDWSGATVQLDNSAVFSATTDTGGNFSILDVPAGTYSTLTADAPGYLPAVCNAPTITAPLTTMASIALLSGDINDDGIVNIEDATAVGVSFGATGSGLAEDINRDGEVDIFDIILVSVNFGQGSQTWVCLP